MSPRGNSIDYAQLVHHALRDARRPLTIDEIVAGVQALEPIHAANPRALVRHLVERSELIVPVAGERYGYLPHLLQDNRFRQPLSPEAQGQGFVELSPELMTALWPGWTGSQRPQETRDASLLLPSGARATLRRRFRLMGHWGLTASPEFWAWLDAAGAQPGDDLLVGAVDVEARAYEGAAQCRIGRDEQAIAQRNKQLADLAEQAVREAGGEILVDRLAPRLIAAGIYAEPLAPDPLISVLAEDGRFVDAGLATVALLEGWSEEDERLAEARQRAMLEAVGEVRPRFRRAGPVEAKLSFADLVIAGRYDEATEWLQRENRIHTDPEGQLVVDLHGLLDEPPEEGEA